MTFNLVRLIIEFRDLFLGGPRPPSPPVPSHDAVILNRKNRQEPRERLH